MWDERAFMLVSHVHRRVSHRQGLWGTVCLYATTAVLVMALPTSAADYTLTVTTTHGSVTVSPAKAQYNEGEEVALVPLPSAGYMFTGWSGDASRCGKELVARVTMTENKSVIANFETWQPPIGIPMPEFGIFESYRMYDDPANRNPELTYNESAGGGYYTHYVDNTDPNATNTNNPYGDINKPRTTIPAAADTPEGSVVEIHGGPYTTQYVYITASGTQAKPIFVRGSVAGTRPIFLGAIVIRGHYIILENMDLDRSEIKMTAVFVRPLSADEQVHHVSVRNCEVHDVPQTIANGSTMLMAVSYLENVYVEDVVFYANYVHPGQLLPPSWAYGDATCTGISVQKGTNRIWIVDNHVCDLTADCIGSGHGANYTAKNYYIGRNVLHDTTQQAVDLKEVDGAVISENDMFNFGMYNQSATVGLRALGVAVVCHSGSDESPKNTWILNNYMHDCFGSGIELCNAQTPPVWIVGNVIYDMRDDIVSPYIMAPMDHDDMGREAYAKCLAKGYIDANGIVDPGFSTVDEEFQGWFPTYYADIQDCLLAVRDGQGNYEPSTATGYRTWDSNQVYVVNNSFYHCCNGVDSDVSRTASAMHLINNIIAEPIGQGYHIKLGNDRTRSEIRNNLFCSSDGQTRILWYNTPYTSLAGFQAATSKGQDCLEGNPLFVDAANYSFNLQDASPAINVGTESDVYDLFYDTHGIGIQTDIEGRARPQGAGWDIGAYEYTLEAIEDLAVSGGSQNSVTIGWTVPGEEGVTGVPASYDIRYSDSEITEENWEEASLVQGEPVAGALGEAQMFTITGLGPGQTYYVAMKVLDEVGHFSELSNVVSETTPTSGNHAPVLNVGDRSATEMAELRFTVDATDADAGDTLSYSAPYLPAGAGFTPATRTFAWTPTFEQIGVHHATFEVDDGQVAVSETIAIAVYSGSNHPPVLDAIDDKSVDEGQTLSFSVSATDIDSGDTLSYSASGLPIGADFSDQAFTWTPTYDQSGTYDVTFTVSDGVADDSETITISVGNVNRAPVLETIGSQSVNENFSLSFSVSATDPDGDSVSYSATGLPSGASFVAGVFTWTPGYDQAGSYPVTFTASDGVLTDSEEITISVTNVSDETPPYVHNCEPAADAIQVPLNTLIALTISDPGWGVDADAVIIYVNDELVYSGNVASYDSAHGVCHRSGSAASYRYTYQPDDLFDYDQEVSVRVSASDLAHNAMAEVSYQFVTEMRSFGRNVRVSWGPDGFDKGSPATVCDSAGNIWAVWHAGAVGERDIYVSRKMQGYSEFADPVRLTVDAGDQSYPDIAVGTDDKLYVTWQDNRRGNWDIYVSTSADGATWSAETRVTDSEDNQVRPAIIVDSQLPDNRAYIAYQDDSAGQQDIYVASSTTDFVNATEIQVTSAVGDQIDPDIAVDAADNVYLVWTDGRNGSDDIYGAASNDGPWTNVPVVTGAGSQSSAAIATEASGSVLHFAWVDDTAGNYDICHASSDAMPVAPLTGTDIVNDTADQTAPAIITTGSTGGGLNIFACWQDARNVATSGDTDVYFVEVGAGSEESVFVGDDGSLSNQSKPALGVDSYGYPYIVWTDDRDGNTEIYYAGSTFMDPYVVDSQDVVASVDHTIGIDPPAGLDDVSVVIPAGASPHDVTVTVTKIQNPPLLSSLDAIGYDFGPSGLQFSEPVTITIPYLVADFGDDSPIPCWYNYDSPLNPLSQEGITDVKILEITPDVVHAVQFKTTHFTPYYLAEALPSSGVVGGGGGGGCSLSPTGQVDPFGFLLPYLGLGIVMVLLRWRDRRAHPTRGNGTCR